jgi:putative addiction module component (TIGR02574 family)
MSWSGGGHGRGVGLGSDYSDILSLRLTAVSLSLAVYWRVGRICPTVTFKPEMRIQINTIAKDILSLSVPERILLVEDICDSIAEIPEEVALTSAQKLGLDQQLDTYHRNPEAGAPWSEVRQRIQGRK